MVIASYHYDKVSIMGERNKEIVAEAMGNLEFYPEIVEDKDSVSFDESERIPWEELLALGAGVAPFANAFQTFMNAAEPAAEMLFKADIPLGGHLAAANDGSGLLGAVFSDVGNKLMGQARFHAVEVAEDMPNPIEINPAMMVMAVALVGIEHKLGEIEETQKAILDLLKEDEKAGLKANLLFLTGIVNDYKYNWDNETYRKSNHVKVLDIRQSAEKSIIKHREMIEKRIEKKKFIQLDKDVKDKFVELKSEIQDYQLAVYLYGMASYLDVMLAESFESKYIQNVINKVSDYSIEYREIYTDIYDKLEREGDKTVQAALIGGLGKITKASGKAIAKVPLISRTQLDENLEDAGDSLKLHKETRDDKRLNTLVSKSSAHVEPFIENLKTVDRMYNQPVTLMFDRNNLYIGGASMQGMPKNQSTVQHVK